MVSILPFHDPLHKLISERALPPEGSPKESYGETEYPVRGSNYKRSKDCHRYLGASAYHCARLTPENVSGK
jgi:hypothetical protein